MKTVNTKLKNGPFCSLLSRSTEISHILEMKKKFCVIPWSDTYISECLSVWQNCSILTVKSVSWSGRFLWDISSSIHPYASDLKFWGYTGLTLWVPWDHFGGSQGSWYFGITFDILLGLFWGYSGVTLKVPCGSYLRVPCWATLGSNLCTLRSLWGYSRVTLGILWNSVGGIFGEVFGHFEGILGVT